MTTHGDKMAKIDNSRGEVSMRTKMPKFYNAEWKRRLSLVLIFTMMISIFMQRGLYSPEPAMAVTYSASGALAYGTSPLAPSYPSGILANDMIVLVIGMKPTTAGSGNSSVTTPTGWTALTPIYGATGTLAADTGPTNLFAFYRAAAGTESGTLSVTTTGANAAWSQIHRFTGNTAWSVVQATGTDTTGGNVSIAFGTNPGVQQGDYIVGAMCIPTDITTPTQFTQEAFTQAGVTFGTVTEISEPDSTTGNDIGGFMVYANVASGTATGNPTMTATAGGTTTNVYGPGVFIRIRETNPPIPGTVTLSDDTGVYTSASPTITTTFGEDASNISGCEYTTNGSTWTAGTLSGSRPTYTCTAKPTGLSGSLTINMRATSGNGTGTAVALTRTADGTGPTDGTLTVTPGTDQNGLSWTAATDGVSGLRTTNPYDVRMVAGATPPTSCSAGTSIYTGTGTSYTHANLVPAAGGYSYRVCAYDKVNNASAGATRTGLPAWSSTTTSCGRCHGYTSIFTDATTSVSRGTPNGAFVGDHDAHVVGIGTPCSTCHVVPGGTDYAHRDGNIQMQGTIAGGSYSKVSPITQVNNPITGTCSTISCHGANNPTPQWGVGTVGCVDCHINAFAAPMASLLSGGTVTQRPSISAEFGLASNHKRSGGAVTNEDCGVCHMEGTSVGGALNATYHANGYIDLRDPDTGSQIQTATWGGAGAGSYTSSAPSASAVRFSRNLGSATLEAFARSMMINQCLKCHDANGANNAAARVTGGTAWKPFNTTVTANTPSQGVLDVASQFATTNRSYHPILGKQNNSYTQGTRMVAPWNLAKTNGNSTSWGYLMTCWDCHAPNGATGTLSRTTTHGGTLTGTDVVPMRGQTYNTGTTAATNYCFTCHAGYTSTDNHLSGSAFSTLGRTAMGGINNGCFICHSSAIAAAQPARPIGAADAHGSSTRADGTAFPAASNGYAFIRSEGFYGSTYQNITRQVGATTYSPNCTGYQAGGICAGRSGMGTYAPGGIY